MKAAPTWQPNWAWLFDASNCRVLGVAERDTIFAEHLEFISEFAFDERVARVFPDMINRSVPGYRAMVAMTGQLAGTYAKPNGLCYDLGCSRGASSLAMASHTPDSCRILAIDSSAAMIELFQQDLEKSEFAGRISTRCGDILEEPIAQADFIAINFTLQFIVPGRRDELMQKIHNGLNSGGACLVSEKIRFEDPQLDELMTELYYDFKRSQGYSEMEISQKRSALERVLIPETPDAHLERMKRAGFSRCAVWFQCLNFCSFLAIR